MVTVWCTKPIIVHYMFLKTEAAITAEKYWTEIEMVHQKVIEKQPVLANRRSSALLYDSTRQHVSKIVVRKPDELGYETLPPSAFSPDLSPID